MSDIRAAFEDAFTKAEETSTPPPEAAPVADATPPPAAPESVATPPPAETTAAQRARDDAGRFAPKGKTAAAAAAKPITKPEATATPAPPAAESTATEAPAPAETTLKAPANWKPVAREKWASLPPEVQAEAVRVEREVQTALRESAAARRTAEGFEATVRPYLPLFQREGAEPLKAIDSLLRTVSVLATGAPAHKAQVLAQLTKAYGVPIEELDSALSGQASQPQAAPQYRDPRVDTLLAQMQAAKQTQAQAELSRAQQEVEAAKAEMEFLDDVRDDMADLIEVASKRGVALSLKDAYSRAVAMHPEVSEALRQREAAKSAETAQAATQRAKAASSSVKSSPAQVGNGAKADDSWRGALEAAWAARSGR